MSLKKKISIKPIHLMVGTPKKERKKAKRERKSINSLFKPNKVKQELLEKIKKHQQKKKDLIQSGSNSTKENDTSFTNSFQESLLYLDNHRWISLEYYYSPLETLVGALLWLYDFLFQ